MKELEQLKNQFDKLNEELEKIDSIGIIRLESIISELESIKKSAKGIVENPGKFSEDIILLSERAIQLTKDVDALSKMVKTAYDTKNKLKAENERDIKSVRDTISRNQEALTEAQVREQIIEGRLKALEERLKYLESSKKTLIEGGNLIVKKTNKKEKEEKPEEKEEKNTIFVEKEKTKKNKTWIVGVVVGIILICLIAFILIKYRKKICSQKNDYVEVKTNTPSNKQENNTQPSPEHQVETVTSPEAMIN